MTVPQHRNALMDFIAAQTGGKVVELQIDSKLKGGAIQENWALDVTVEGGSLPGRHRLVLRTDAATSVSESRSRAEEFALIKTAFDAGMTVPEPLWAEPDGKVIGKPFTILRRLGGAAEPRNVLGQLSELEESGDAENAGDDLAAILGRQIATLHQVMPASAPAGLGFLKAIGPDFLQERLTHYRRRLDALPEAQPVLEWALNWIEDRLPKIERITLCHRDFRLGNIMVEEGKLSGILDFEFAGWSDPDEDLGWFCARCWRFGAYDKEAGGIGSKEAFFAGYAEVAHRQPDPQRIRFWEIVATLRWALIAIDQGERCFSGGERSIDLALTSLRAIECTYDLLLEIEAYDAPPKPSRHGGKHDQAAHDKAGEN